MIRHVVMWKLKEQADGLDRQANAKRLKKALEELPTKVPGLVRWIMVGINEVEGPSSYDVVLMVDFDSFEDLERYIKHPEHDKVAELVMKVREQRTVVDFQF